MTAPRDRVAVVTGGASGIGLGCARRLVEAGHAVAVFDLQADLVAAAIDELGCAGHVVDATDRAAIDEAMTDVRSVLGPVTIMVTSAAIDVPGSFLDLSAEVFERALRVNLTGTFHSIQAAIPDMVEAGWGRVVTISSSSAQSGAPGRSAYVASKGGVIALTKAVAVEFAKQGITANTIPPSIIDTPMARTGIADGTTRADLDTLATMTPVGRVGLPADVGAMCAFLCSDDAGFITGQQIGVNGGWYI